MSQNLSNFLLNLLTRSFAEVSRPPPYRGLAFALTLPGAPLFSRSPQTLQRAVSADRCMSFFSSVFFQIFYSFKGQRPRDSVADPILVRIRIRGFVPLSDGSESGSSGALYQPHQYMSFFSSVFSKIFIRLRGSDLETVLRIHDILVRIRICGSMPLSNGSGSCYFHH